MAIPQDSDLVELAINKKTCKRLLGYFVAKKTFKTLIEKNLGEQMAN